MYRKYLESLGAGNQLKDQEKSARESQTGNNSDIKLKAKDATLDIPSYYQRPTDDAIQRTYHGSLDVPKLPRGRNVRFFTSSTFTDTAVERNALMSKVFPKLKSLCQNEGYEMQIVDMRWGVRDEMTDDHMTNALCMRELELCQKVSTGPNFVTFLGQKYGYRPFPPKIEAKEFESILAACSDLGDQDLLSQWFIKDENKVPPIYVLQPISSKFPNFVSKDKELQRAAGNAWWEIFERLQGILQQCASKAFTDEEIVHKYYRSVTEEEIYNGILKAENPNFHTCWFKRTITDLYDHLGEKGDRRFFDVAGGKMVQDSHDFLKVLREEKIPAVLDDKNVISYDIKWCSDGGVNPDEDPDHKEYLEKFLTDFERILTQRIKGAIEARANAEIKETVFQEVIDHATVCFEKIKTFHGRQDVLSSIDQYISGISRQPCVVYGESGSGKTSVMAMAIKQAQSRLENGTAIIYRFLGTTSQSSTIRLLLHSICTQVCHIYGLDTAQVPQSYQKLMEALPTYLSSATTEKPLVIFLDSLDQLAVDDGARQMVWLPNKLPENVKMVLSTLPEEKYEVYPQLRLFLPSDEHYIPVPILPTSAAADILESWLAEDGLALQKHQREVVLQSFEKCPLPLYLRLAYDEAQLWKSYTQRGDITLKTTVSSVIGDLFDRLEKKHGFLLISHSFSYIAASKNGLSEAELEDLLSCDEEVLDDVYQYWVPPQRRIPPMLWARIRADLGPYLVERGSDGVQVMNWYHRQFIEEVTARYLSPENHTTRVAQLAEYFLGVWAGDVEKPYKNKNGEECREKRFVSAQPFYFGPHTNDLKTRKFNLRKLSELPYVLLQCKDIGRLKENVVCNFEFLLNKIAALSLSEVLDDLNAAEEFSCDQEVEIMKETLQVASQALDGDPAGLSAQLIGRLTRTVEEQGNKYPSIKSLLDQARHPSVTCLVPSKQCLYPPGGQLIHTLPGHSDSIYGLGLTKDGKYMLSCSLDQTLRLWDLHKGRLVRKVQAEEDLHLLQLCCHDNMAVTSSKTAFNVWKVRTGEHIHRIPVEDGPLSFSICGEEEDHFIALATQCIKVWNISTGEIKHEYPDELLTTLGQAKLAADGTRFAYFNFNIKPLNVSVRKISDNSVISEIPIQMICQSMMIAENKVIICTPRGFQIADMDTGEEIKSIPLFGLYQPLRLQVTKDGKFLFGGVADVVQYWDLETGVQKDTCKQPSGSSISNLVSRDLKILAVTGADHTIRLYDTSRDNPIIDPAYTFGGLDKVGSLTLTPMTQRHAVGVIAYNEDQPVFVYDIISGQKVRKFKGFEPKSVTMISDSVVFVDLGNEYRTYDLRNGKMLKSYPFKSHRDRFVVLKPDYVMLHSECQRKVLRLNLDTDAVDEIVIDLDPSIDLYNSEVAFEKNGQSALYGYVSKGEYQTTNFIVIDLTEGSNYGKQYKIPFEFSFRKEKYAGKYLLVNKKGDKSSEFQIFDLSKGVVVHCVTEDKGMSLDFVYSEKKDKFLCSFTSNIVRIFDCKTWTLSNTLDVYCLDIKLLRDDTVIMTSSSFASSLHIAFWDMSTGKQLVNFNPDESFSRCHTTDDGNYVVVGFKGMTSPITFRYTKGGQDASNTLDEARENVYGEGIEETIELLK